MRNLGQINNDIEQEIAESGNDKLQELWLELLAAKSEKERIFCTRIIEKDPVVIGATIGGLIGHLFSNTQPAEQ